MTMGVSVIICCHNSERVLPETLQALAAQRFDRPIEYEILLVDNASTDRSVHVARAAWPDREAARLRIVSEPQLGVAYARLRGIREARYEALSFVDSDNRVCDSWVSRVAAIMREHPEVGACGGRNFPVTDGELPAWFPVASSSYAVGPQGEAAGDVTESRGYFWGAGLSLRAAAIRELFRKGFAERGTSLRLRSREGAGLNSGEDTEICFALRLAGWRLWYDPELQLRHYLPSSRLSWSHVRRLNQGFGRASVHLDPYEIALSGFGAGLRREWAWRTGATLKQLVRHGGKALLSRVRSLEGDPDVLAIEQTAARLGELLRARKGYQQAVADVQRAAWRTEAVEA